jgi:hypothetical protein
MSWNILALLLVLAASGILSLVFALRLAGVEDGSPLNAPSPADPMDEAWQTEPVQTFMWQGQVARYWQPPFCQR